MNISKKSLIKKATVPITALAVVCGVLVAPGTVAAASTNHHFVGFAGGSALEALGNTVVSDLTSASSVDTVDTGVTSTNTALTADVLSGLLHSSTITTSATTRDITGGVQLFTHAHTENASLLNGAISVGAVDTNDTATVLDNAAHSVSSEINTTLVALKIGNKTFPVNVKKNTAISIPGIATIVINMSATMAGPAGSGVILTFGAGLAINLLSALGGHPRGTQIFLNPVYSAITTVTQESGPLISGSAFATEVTASAGKLLNAHSGPTAQISQPFGGTHGVDKFNTTAAVNLPNILNVAAITDFANGVKSNTTVSYSKMTTKLGHINLLGGLITADAATGIAQASANPDGTTFTSTSVSLLNLVMAGHPIDISTKPNTGIKIGNLLTITIGFEAKSPFAAVVKVLDIVVNTASYGLPAGAEVLVGVARAAVQPVQGG